MKINEINLNNFRRWCYVYCNGCRQYVARRPFPARYAWIIDQQKLDRTVVMTDDMDIADKPIMACRCVKQGRLL